MSDLKTGVEIVSFAIFHDQVGRIKEAIYLYQLSIQFLEKAKTSIFLNIIIFNNNQKTNKKKVETNQQTKSIIHQKIIEYSNRVKQLSNNSNKTTIEDQFSKLILEKIDNSKGDISLNNNLNEKNDTQKNEILLDHLKEKNLQNFVTSPPQIDWTMLQKAEKESIYLLETFLFKNFLKNGDHLKNLLVKL